MSIIGSMSVIVSIPGNAISQVVTKTADHSNNYVDIVLPIATEMLTFLQAGTGTLSPGHGLSTGTYDVYWADGVRYGVAVTIVTNAVTVMAGGAGDSLPVDATTVNISEQVDINVATDGDAIVMMSMNATKRSNIDFLDVGDASIEAIELLANEPFVWHNTNGITNPFTGNPITSAVASNGDATAAATITILILEDSTP